jgi:hypothetical protein
VSGWKAGPTEKGKLVMEQVKQLLDPVIDLLPPGLQDYWWVFAGVVALMVVLLVLALVKRLFRAVFGRRSAPVALNLGPQENLDEYPLPGEPWGPRRLTVEGVPVRLRLVIVASMGKQTTIPEGAVEELLDQVLWGLGTIARTDRPKIRLWPPQLSHQGFVAAFHRATPRPEPEGQPSRWILVAGQTPPRPRPLLLGLALWADEPVYIGRLTLEPGRWADVLRIQSLEG